MKRHPRHLRLADREQLEVDIALGVPNHQIMSRYRLSYEQLKNFIDEMNRDPWTGVTRGRPVAPCGTETAFDRHRRAKETCVKCEQEHTLLLARRAAARRAARHQKAEQRAAEQEAMGVQRAEIDADKRLRGVA